MTDLGHALDGRLARGDLELPVMPRAAQEVLRLSSAEGFDLRVAAEIVRSDPTLAAHVLRVANSPMFRGFSAVVSLHQALARLGAVQIQQIMYVIACETRALKVRGREVEAKRWLSHALDAAWFAQEIARLRRESVEEAFLCGLLHDVGVPVLWQLVSDIESRESRIDPAVVEAALAPRHASVGAAVAERWDLPPRVVDAIRTHHSDDALSLVERGRGSAHFLRGALALADALASGAAEAPGPVVIALDLYPEEIAGLLEQRRAGREAA